MRRLIPFLLAGLLAGDFVQAAIIGQIVETPGAEGRNATTTVHLEHAGRYNAFVLQSPRRLVIDLHDRAAACRVGSPRPPAIILRIRHAVRGAGCRVVFDLAAPVEYAIQRNQARPALILTLKHNGGKREPADGRPAAAGRDAVIVVDPGHGGRDPGAVSGKGTLEKDVTLATAKQLLHLINREYGMRALLTRNRDRFVKLRERLHFAQRHKADLFVSIHADSEPSRSAVGASVYVLSNKGASSEAARLLAQRENKADLIAGVELQEEDPDVAGILIDLEQSASLDHSKALAGEILRAFKHVTKTRRIEAAGFAVLKAADIPSVLIELGYLSNSSEEKRLKTAAHRRRLANGIVNGIRHYFARYASADMLLAQVNVQEYQVVKGDTLSEIALKFGVKVAAIKRFSKLASDRIRVGQRIKIPLARKNAPQ